MLAAINCILSPTLKATMLIVLVAAGSGYAQTSRPAEARKLPYLECQNTTVDHGTEGKCVYKTKDGEFEIGYSLEGNVRRSLKGVPKNLVVLLHPATNSYRLREWWAYMVGTGKPLDPNQHTLLSMGILGDGRPQLGNPEKLTVDILLAAQGALIDELFPKARFLLGGVSRGGQNAILLAGKLSSRIKGLFLIAAHGAVAASETAFERMLNQTILKHELQFGPYGTLSDREHKRAFWKNLESQIPKYYTSSFFESPAATSYLGLAASEYKNRQHFERLVFDGWIDWLTDTTDAVWMEKQAKVINQALDDPKISSRLKFPVLLVSFNEDQWYPLEEYSQFVSGFRNRGLVKQVKVSDMRGHMACCLPDPPKEMVRALVDFIGDRL